MLSGRVVLWILGLTVLFVFDHHSGSLSGTAPGRFTKILSSEGDKCDSKESKRFYASAQSSYALHELGGRLNLQLCVDLHAT